MVAQEDRFGCGVACVANRLEIPYKEALELFASPDRAIDGDHCYISNIAEALRAAGVDSTRNYIKSKLRSKIYQPGTIVAIKKNRRYRHGHYLLRVEGGWLDPFINLPTWPAKAGMRKRLPGRPIYAVFS